MKTLLILIFALLAFAPSVSAAPPKITKEKIVSGGKNRTYYLFVPEKLPAANTAPLLVLLHGSGRNGSSLVEKWQDLAAKEGIILVGPNASDSALWATPEDGPDFLRDVVEVLKAKYPINARRVYLFGHSAGASHALYMSLYESQYFAATAIHAGALEPQDYKAIDLAQRKIPIAIWVGTADQYFPLATVRATRDALNARGFNSQLTEMQGHDHWYYDLAPKINQAAWAFLQMQELSEDPKYQQYNFGK